MNKAGGQKKETLADFLLGDSQRELSPINSRNMLSKK